MAYDNSHGMYYPLSMPNKGWSFLAMNFANGMGYSTTDFNSLSSNSFPGTSSGSNWGGGYITFGGLIWQGSGLYTPNGYYFNGFIHTAFINDQYLSPGDVLNLYVNPGKSDLIL